MTHHRLLHDLLAPADSDGRLGAVVVGIVTNNQDPENLHRVKVRFPWLSSRDESHWARVASGMAGGGRGAYFLPEVDDEVLVAFEHGSVEHPFVIGSLWNGKDAPPERNEGGANDMRSITSRSGHVIRLNDKSGGETIEVIDRSGNNRIVIETASNKITILAQGDIDITSRTGKLTLSAVGIEIASQADVKITAATTLDASATAQASIAGLPVKLN